MKIFVLDPRGGDLHADLFLIDARKATLQQLRLGYVPEIHYDAAARELVVVETEFEPGNPVERYWLKCYSDTLELVRQCETPERPMRSGYPGRSTFVTSTPSGRYVYLLGSKMIIRHPVADDVIRLRVHRYDRQRGVLEAGGPVIESCLIDFGTLGNREDELYFHLCCDAPSTVVFGSFGSPETERLQVEETPPRMHRPQETCGAWLAGPAGPLYCITGEGKVYQVRRRPCSATLLTHLPLRPPQTIPLYQIHGGGAFLFVGVAANIEERSLGQASEVWQLPFGNPNAVRVLPLPVPVTNFVTTPNGRVLVGISAYEKVLFLLDTQSGRTLARMDDLGCRPGEVLLMP